MNMYSKKASLEFMLLLLIVTGISVGFGYDFDYKGCHKGPSFANCFSNEIERIFPSFSKSGIPKFGVPPIDPYELGPTNISKGHGPMSFSLQLMKCRIFGIHSFKFLSMNADTETLKMDAIFTSIDPIKIIGDYQADGRIYVFNIRTQGQINITMINCTWSLQIQGEQVERNNVKYMTLKRFSGAHTGNDGTIFHMTNLIKGNERLNNDVNALINEKENSKLLFKEMEPDLEKLFFSVLKNEVIDRILENVSIDDIIRQ